VHGPLSPLVRPEAAMVETNQRRGTPPGGRTGATGVVGRAGFAIVTGLTNRLRNYLTALTQEVWRLEQTVTDGHLGDPEQFLEELFRVRHGLLAILWVPRTLALALTWARAGRPVHLGDGWDRHDRSSWPSV